MPFHQRHTDRDKLMDDDDDWESVRSISRHHKRSPIL
jgi:hypothetical protein